MSEFRVRKLALAREYGNNVNTGGSYFNFLKTTDSQIVLLMASLLVLFIFLAGMYLVHYNQVVSRGYVLRDLEEKKQDLLLDFERSDSSLAKYESLSYVRESDVLDRMVRVNDVIYVKNSGSDFAMNVQ